MKAQDNKLSFAKNTMVELNKDDLLYVKGGSYTDCGSLVIGLIVPIKVPKTN